MADRDHSPRIAAAAEAADATLMVGFNYRFERTAETVVGAREAGRFGEVFHVDANYIRRRGIPDRGTWFTRKAVAGGGSLIDIGVHAIDLALYLLGYPEVVEVTGITRSQFGGDEEYASLEMPGDDRGPEGFDVDDSVNAFLRCRDGRTVCVDVAWATNRTDSDEFVVRGTRSGASFSMVGDEVSFYDADPTNPEEPLPPVTVETGGEPSHRTEQAYFFDCIAEGREPERNTAEQGLAVQRIIDAVYTSSVRGRAVRLDETATQRSDARAVVTDGGTPD